MSKKRGLLQRAATRLARRFSLPYMLEMPSKVQVVPTNACNLRCQACPKTWYDTDNRHMPPEIYDLVRSGMFKGVRELHFQGLGEPTIAPLFDRMIEDARQRKIPIHFVTNTFKLTDERIAVLAECDAHVTISLDGATAESHEWSRTARSNFAHVMETLEKLKQAKNSGAGGNITLQISTVVTRRNVGEIVEIIGLAKRFEATAMALITPGIGGRDDDYALEAIGRHEAEYRRHMPAILEAGRAAGIILHVPSYLDEPKTETPDALTPKAVATVDTALGAEPAAKPVDGNGRSESSGNGNGRPGRIFPQKCWAPFHEVYIEVDGHVHPCCFAGGVSMGQLQQDDLATIWNNKHYRRLRRTVNSDNPPEFCRSCSVMTGINGGDETFLEKYYAQGNPELPPPPKIGLSWSKEKQEMVEG